MLLRRLAPFLLLTLVASGARGQDLPGLGFAFRPTESGLLVQVLADDGPAYGAGLLEGDLVTTVAGKKMPGLAPEAIGDWMRKVSGGGIPVILDVRRDGGATQVTITPTPYSREALAAKVKARAEIDRMREALALLPRLTLDDLSVPDATPTPEARPPIPASGVGCLVGDCRNGYGATRLAGGQTYEGDFYNGMRSGQGTLTFPDGSVYVGTFANSLPTSGTLQQPGASPRPVRYEGGTFVYTD